jgi:hypothetical protein
LRERKEQHHGNDRSKSSCHSDAKVTTECHPEPVGTASPAVSFSSSSIAV